MSVPGPHLDASSAASCARSRPTSFIVLSLIAAGVLASTTASSASNSARSASTFPGGAYFNLACGFSHRNNDDPILYPGQPGRSHNHTYIGNTAVDASSTPASLRRGETTCELDEDMSTYWVPTLFLGNEPVLPYAGVVYYVKLIPQRLAPFPADLKMLAGNPMARIPQKRSIASWSCGGVGGSRRFAAVQACSEDEALELRVVFPNCWNGRTSDSANHKRHMTYASGGKCPATHPVAVPSLIVVLLYPPVSRSARPASGRFAAHADFMNGWDQDALSRLVASLNY